ncbi:hypothetical protein M569_05373, partial [Genlisea aurea]
NPSSPNSNGSSTNNSDSTPRSQDQAPQTTFIQAEPSNFKQVVQMLTGSSDPPPPAPRAGGVNIPPIKSAAQKRPGFKLYERRNSLKSGLMIGTGFPNGSAGFSPRKSEILSPSVLDFPALVLSPASPLNRLASPRTEEEKAIAEKKFYFHPSPRKIADPQLLPLFPDSS